MIIYYSAEIEEYEEANNKVKLVIYRNIEDKNSQFVRVVAEIPEISRLQAEAAMEGFNKSIPGLQGTIARFEYLMSFKQDQ